MIIPSKYKNPLVFFNEVKPILENKIKDELEALLGLKHSIGVEVLLRKDNDSGKPAYTDTPSRLYTEKKAVRNQDNIDIDEQTSSILKIIEEFVYTKWLWLEGRFTYDIMA